MEIHLKDLIRPRLGVQCALQGAGATNKASIGEFLNLTLDGKSIFFSDAKHQPCQLHNYSSVYTTTMAGSTFNTSSRLGLSWLNGE